jgi:predicted CXXCH cytochrome family protein
MRRQPATALLVVAVCVAAATALAQPGSVPPAPKPPEAASSAAGRCGVCHPAERVQFERSRHAQEDVHCVSCHGGDDRSIEQSLAHGGGFIGRPRHADVPRLCASCHANEEAMRPYNLPVDQYALYQTSGHGRRLARGDTRVAVCSDCHGAHDILPPSDPSSRVFPINIPKTCGRCHGDSTMMGAERGRPDVYREYLGSVHAHELFDRGNPRAPTCVSCHGVHGAAPPGAGDIDKVCGRCHTAERRYLAAGPHYEGMARTGLPECVSCHSHHNIQAAEPRRLATLCATCHGGKSAPATLGGKMWTEYQAAATQIEQAEALITQADAVPIATDDYHARLEEARTYLREALPAAHAAQEQTVAGLTSRARSVGAEVAAEIYGNLGHLQARKIGLIVFWFYLLLTVLVLRRFQSRAARKD